MRSKHNEKKKISRQNRNKLDCQELSDMFTGYGEHSIPPQSFGSRPYRSTLISLLCISFVRFTAKCRQECTCGQNTREYETPYENSVAPDSGNRWRTMNTPETAQLHRHVQECCFLLSNITTEERKNTIITAGCKSTQVTTGKNFHQIE